MIWDLGEPWLNTIVTVAVIVVAAFVIGFIADRLIDRMLRMSAHHAKERATGKPEVADAGGSTSRTGHRINTLGQTLKVFVHWALAIIAVVMILNELGFNTAPLLASAGIGGVALGLGAQSVIKDLLGGMFLILEDQFGVGDTIIVGGLEGTVQSIGVRVTRIQDVDGAVWYVRNGEISTLGNKSQR